MMRYRVAFTSRAQLELHQTALWWAENRDAEQAARWLQGFESAIESLAENPERCATSPESSAFPFPLRQLLFGLGRRPTHRAVFRIREHDVVIYGIRHLAQRELMPAEFGLSPEKE